MLANPQKKKKSRLQGTGALARPAPKGSAGSAWSQPVALPDQDLADEEQLEGVEQSPERQPLELIHFNTGGTILKEERPYPPGLFKKLDFLTEAEEEDLLCHIDKERWSNDLPRRTQQFGFKFCYATNNLEAAKPIPSYYDAIIDRLCQVTGPDGDLVFPQRPNQMIVNEYAPGQGINAHLDRELFEDGIVSISLLSDIQMIFDSDLSHTGRVNVIETDPQQKMQVQPLTDTMVPVWLDRRCLVVMRGDSRYKWSHEIPARAHDSKNGRMVRRKRRISVTFRVVRKQFRNLAKLKPSAKPPAKGAVEAVTSGTSNMSLADDY